MNEEIILRRKEEIEALASFYGEDLVPSLEEDCGNFTVIPPEGPWFIKLIPNSASTCATANGKGVPILEIRLPPNYPLSCGESLGEVSGLPEPILHHTISYNFSYERKKSLIDELMEMYEPDVDMDVAIMWAERCRQEFLHFGSRSAVEANYQTITSSRTDERSSSDHQFEQNQQKSGDYSQLGRLCIRFLNYNHLLHGKSHKKEADLVSCAAKMGLSGFVVYGTPGIVGLLVCYGSNDAKKSNGSYGVRTMECDVAEFAKECGRIGKRATLLDFTVELTPDGLHPSCLDADDKSNGTNGRGIEENKKSTHSKNHGRSKRGGGDKLIGSGLKNFTPNRKGIGALLLDLLGPDKINGGVDTFTATVSKAGLKSFDSFGDLKQVFTSHGLHDTFFPQILGLT